MQINNSRFGNLYPTEEQLLKEIYQGNISAFWELWNQHKDYLYNHCLRWMDNNYAEAEEVMSFSMLRAWEKLPKHAFKVTNVRAWLTRITYNLCIDIHRKKEYSLSIGESPESIPLIEDNLLSSKIDSPETTILRSELRLVLYHLIKTLPKNLQTPIILKFIQDKTYREISDIMSIPENNVRKRIQKGRILLKQSITPYLEGTKNFQLLTKIENEDNIFCLSNLQFEQSAHLKSDLQKMREQDLETLVYRLSATHLETLPHKHFSLNGSLSWY